MGAGGCGQLKSSARPDALGLASVDPVQPPSAAASSSTATAAIQAAQQKKGGNQQILMLLNRHGVNEYVALSMEGNGGTG